MTDGIDAAMDPVQPSRLRPTLYRPTGDTGRQQLRVGHDAVLPAGHLGYRVIAAPLVVVLTTVWVVGFTTLGRPNGVEALTTVRVADPTRR
ncbi:MAG TPA: hypothetical protein VEW67_03545 [Thermoleophilaceae bacterium]|nr:hypothetical protein [Thermoleophilaceae bacterium]